MRKLLSIGFFSVVFLLSGCNYYQTSQDKINEILNQQETVNYNDTKDVTFDDLLKRAEFTNYYAVVGQTSFDGSELEPNKIVYEDIDNLGRAKGVFAHITKEMIENEKEDGREEIKVDPVGFVDNKKVIIKDKNLGSYKGYFYNRSHLLADSLGGDAELHNLVTGTRMQNVGMKNKGGMAYIEEKVREYFKGNNGTVLYKATPIYHELELVPRYVTVEAKSSDDKINEFVIVSNTAEGFEIDYLTGKWSEVK